ncbi:hypothetical protein [Streptomyces sp. NPDC005784]|uniref:hypothetical protein n=1 Tax=Streptomyces sp. NPDC005784 TaxID=3364731 RepID=UPI0036BBB5DC
MAIDENHCEAFTALGERFGYPEFLVDDNLNVAQGRPGLTAHGPRRAKWSRLGRARLVNRLHADPEGGSRGNQASTCRRTTRREEVSHMPRFTPFDFGVSWVMGLFHQDWTHEGNTAADVVAKYLAASVDEEAQAVRRDARILGNLPSPTLEVLWDAGAQYMPSFERLGGRSRVDADGRRPV